MALILLQRLLSRIPFDTLLVALEGGNGLENRALMKRRGMLLKLMPRLQVISGI